jgi:transcriptional regulator with XRE-family HTH domain
MNDCMTFGNFVKAVRLANGITARDSSQGAGMLPSNFSKLEHGALKPPQDGSKQKQLADAIGIKFGTSQETEFFDLAAKANNAIPADLADIISKEDAVPLLLRTIGNKRLNKSDIERLIEIVRGTSDAGKKLH